MNGARSFTIREARDGIRSGALSSVELMEACLDAADRLDNKLNVFVTRVDREVLLQQAAHIDRRRKTGIELGPLAEVPIALKDIYFTSDLSVLSAIWRNTYPTNSPDHRPCVFRVGSLKEDCRSACSSSGVTSMS